MISNFLYTFSTYPTLATSSCIQVEILVKYNQLDNVMVQLTETTKKPRAGTSPLIAVPLRLDLTPEQVDKILG
jgi:hypothetical protein